MIPTQAHEGENRYRHESVNLPAPRIELAMFAIEFSSPPPECCFVANSSMSIGAERPSSSGASKPRLISDASMSPTSRGVVCSRLRLRRGGRTDSICGISSSSLSASESSSNSIHSQYRVGRASYENIPASLLSYVDLRGGAKTRTCTSSRNRTV